MYSINNNTLRNTRIQQIPQGITYNTVSSVKPTINIECLPLEVWDNIAKTCGSYTLLKLRAVSKTIYCNTLSIMINLFCQKQNFNNYAAFSVENYFKFIKPKLFELLPSLINIIEEYIQNNSNQENFHTKFAKFLFYKMHHLENIIPKTVKATTIIPLNNTQIRDTHPDYIRFFALSFCGNFCLTVNVANTITVYEVTSEFNLKKSADFNSITEGHIESIFFTEQNKICVVSNYHRTEGYKSKLTLYRFEPYKLALIKFAELTSNKVGFIQAIINHNETKLILLTRKLFDYINIDLEIWELSQNQFINKTVLDKSQIMLPSSSFGVDKTNYIKHIATNVATNILALSVGANLTADHVICFLALNKEKPIFRREEIAGQIEMQGHEARELYVKEGLQLNRAGDFCVFTSNYQPNVIGLKRKINIWYKIFVIHGSYFSLNLTPYENNLLAHRVYLKQNDSELNNDMVSIPIVKHNFSDRSSKLNDNKAFIWKKEISNGLFNLHRTGLAVLTFNDNEQCIESIVIEKLSVLNRLKRSFKLLKILNK